MAPRTNPSDRHGAAPPKSGKRQTKTHVSDKQHDDVEERSSPSTPVIYEIVRRLGDEEMERPITSLWWSGVAGGLSIAFSLLAQSVFPTRRGDRWSAVSVIRSDS
jgi:hypothetical protein